MSITPPPSSQDCEAIAELLAWHANGTLGALDRAAVDAHIAVCEGCRTALALERRIVDSIRAPRDNVEQAPHAGWQRLTARLDGNSAPSHPRKPGSRTSSHRKAAPRPSSSVPSTPVETEAALTGAVQKPQRLNWSAALGIAVAVQAAAIAVLAVALVRHRQAEEAPRFHTLASADTTLTASGTLVRIAFDATVDETAARGVAEKVAGRILAGPSPDNVYTIVFQTAHEPTRSVDDKVSWLRRQAHVLLVEPVFLGPPVSSGKQ